MVTDLFCEELAIAVLEYTRIGRENSGRTEMALSHIVKATKSL